MYKVGSEEWIEKIIKEFAGTSLMEDEGVKKLDKMLEDVEIHEEFVKLEGNDYEIPKYGTDEWVRAYDMITEERLKLPEPYLMGFPEWCYLFEKGINEGSLSEKYKEVAKDWEWDVALHIFPEETLGVEKDLYINMGLYHGECRPNSLRMVNEEDAYKSPYVIHGTYDQWTDVSAGKLRIVKALMKGEMTLTGDLKRMMKEAKATKVLIDVQKTILSISPDDLSDEAFDVFKRFIKVFRNIAQI
jgi:putative sterol carrier protein